MSKEQGPENVDGYFPKDGALTAYEIARRLRLKSVRALQDELEKKGIAYQSLCGKRVYPCDQIMRLFWED